MIDSESAPVIRKRQECTASTRLGEAAPQDEPKQEAQGDYLIALDEMERLLLEGEQAGAAELLLRCKLAGAAPADRLRLARLAERAGALDRAVSEYNLLLTERPDSLPALYALARLLTDRGEAERAMSCYRKVLSLQPGETNAAVELGALLEEAGLIEEAITLYQEVAARQEQQQQQQLELAVAAALARGEHSGQATAGELEQVGNEAPIAAPGDQHAVMLAELFAGREGVHARQWSSEGGRTGYSPVREPFTPALARQHLMGTYTLGVYPLRLDNTVRFLCLDLDLERELLRRTGVSPRQRLAALGRVQEAAARMQALLAGVGMTAHIEDSGSKGRHLWVLLDQAVPATRVRRLARLVLAAVELPPGVSAEVFPRQSRVEPGALGNLVKIPLGVHRASGRRSIFLDAGGRPLPDQLETLLHLRRVSAADLDRALQALEPAGSGGEGGDRGTSAKAEALGAVPDDDRLILGGECLDEQPVEPSALWRKGGRPAELEVPYRLEDDLEAQQILSGCAVLAEIVRRVGRTATITSDERLVLTHTLGCLSRGAPAVNAVLAQVEDLDPALLLTSRLRGSPTSCARVRTRVPGLAERVGCNCCFQPGAGLYPTPLLHAAELPGRAPLAAKGLALDRAVEDYLKLRGELSRVSQALLELGQRLRGLMTEQQLESLETSVGRLRPGPGEADLVLEL